MSTLADIKAAVANYFEKTVSDLTVNGQDLFLVAANQVRQLAEMQHDFEFNRKLLTLTFNGVTGGSLLNAVIKGTATTVDIKTFIDVGVFDTDGNLRPTRWSTTIDELRNETMRQPIPRYPADGMSSWGGRLSEFVLSGDTLNVFPLPTTGESQSFAVGIEAYVFTPDWTAVSSTLTVTGTAAAGTYLLIGVYNTFSVWAKADFSYFVYYDNANGGWIIRAGGITDDPDAPFWYLITLATSPIGTYTANGTTGSPVITSANVSDIWTTRGSQYIQWATIVQLNHYFKQFVARQEGNISDQSPKEQAATALDALKTWDAYKYEQFRRR